MNKRALKKYYDILDRKGKKAAKHELRMPAYDGKEFATRQGVLLNAYHAWASWMTLRKTWERNERFLYGDQLADVIPTRHGYVRERTMLEMQGIIPNQYNIMRSVMRTYQGVWSSAKTIPSVIAQEDDAQLESDWLTAKLQQTYRGNRKWQKDLAQTKVLAATGVAAFRVTWQNRNGKRGVCYDFLNPYQLGIDNAMIDPTYEDCRLVTYFDDYPIEQIIGMFGRGSKEREERIRREYGAFSDERVMSMVETATDERLEKDFFLVPVERQGLFRVIEVWEKVSKPCMWVDDQFRNEFYADYNSTESQLKVRALDAIKEQREMGVPESRIKHLTWEAGSDEFWKYYYLTPNGVVLDEGISPYWHNKCPIVFELHDFFLGKVYPFFTDLIDVQRQINDIWSISKLLMRFSAKQLLLMPVSAIAEEEGYGLDYLEQHVSDYDAVLPYNDSANGKVKPEFLSTISDSLTPLNVVQTLMTMSEKVTGLYGAAQGQTSQSGTPATLYAQQAQNSVMSLNTIFESIQSFREACDTIAVQEILQYEDAGEQSVWSKKRGERISLDPAKVRDIEAEVHISENTDTPAYRMMMNDLLMQLKQFDANNVLDLRAIADLGAWPFKEKLINYINEHDQAMQAMQQGQQGVQVPQMPDDLRQQLSGMQFSPEVLEQFGKLPAEEKENIMASLQGNGAPANGLAKSQYQLNHNQ